MKDRRAELLTKWKRMVYKLKNDIFIMDNLAIIGVVVLCLAFVWMWANSTARNWEQRSEVEQAEEELALIELEVEIMKYENEYYASDEYLELEARRLQNKVLPGEKLVYLPANSEEAKHKHDEQDGEATLAEANVNNLEQWLEFLFGG